MPVTILCDFNLYVDYYVNILTSDPLDFFSSNDLLLSKPQPLIPKEQPLILYQTLSFLVAATS